VFGAWLNSNGNSFASGLRPGCEPPRAKTNLGKALESVLGWDQFETTVEEAERFVEPFYCDFLDEMRGQYPTIRQYSPTLLNTLEFRVAPPSASLLKAIELLREMNESGKRKVPKSAPRGFVRQRWAPTYPQAMKSAAAITSCAR